MRRYKYIVHSCDPYSPECPITDVMTASGLDFDEQLGPNRRYILTDENTGRVYDFDVNLDRNEWISRKDNVGGGLPELVGWLPEMGLPYYKSYNCSDIIRVLRLYLQQWQMPKSISFTDIRIGKSAVVSIEDLHSPEVLSHLAMCGISLKTAMKAGCKEAVVFDRKAGRTTRMLAFPCENDSYYLSNGVCYRPVEDGGISVVGKYHRDQFCYVHRDWSDCLAMMEMCHRNHIGILCENSRHLVINGNKNIAAAMKFLKENPDFREVRCMLPKGKEGDAMFLKIAEATGGTATDWSCLYEGLPSMALTVRHPIPNYYKDVFVKADREAYEESIGLTKVDKKHVGNEEKAQETVKKPELKIEPKGEVQKFEIESEKILSRPKRFRR